jgi:hypothetical protein
VFPRAEFWLSPLGCSLWVYLIATDQRYDAIAIDAFTSDGTIPEQFTKKEFFLLTKKVLDPFGVLVMNVMVEHDLDMLADHIALNIESAKIPTALFDRPGRYDRTVIIAGGAVDHIQISSSRKPEWVREELHGTWPWYPNCFSKPEVSSSGMHLGRTIMRDTSMLGPWIRRFLMEHLISERNLARNTQRGYRDSIQLLLPAIARRARKPIDRLAVTDVSADRVRQFLGELEEKRDCTIATRNQRLAAIRSLARFIGLHAPELVEWCGQVRAVPFKKAPKTLVPYLEKAEMDALLAVPD